jgi:hypothetical protein
LTALTSGSTCCAAARALACGGDDNWKKRSHLAEASRLLAGLAEADAHALLDEGRLDVSGLARLTRDRRSTCCAGGSGNSASGRRRRPSGRGARMRSSGRNRMAAVPALEGRRDPPLPRQALCARAFAGALANGSRSDPHRPGSGARSLLAVREQRRRPPDSARVEATLGFRWRRKPSPASRPSAQAPEGPLPGSRRRSLDARPPSARLTWAGASRRSPTSGSTRNFSRTAERTP